MENTDRVYDFFMQIFVAGKKYGVIHGITRDSNFPNHSKQHSRHYILLTLYYRTFLYSPSPDKLSVAFCTMESCQVRIILYEIPA